MDIVRDGETEATNYFFGVPGQEEELGLTFNHDGRSYELGTGYGHVAIGVDDLDVTLARLEGQGIEPEGELSRVREAPASVSYKTRIVTSNVELNCDGARAVCKRQGDTCWWRFTLRRVHDGALAVGVERHVSAVSFFLAVASGAPRSPCRSPRELKLQRDHPVAPVIPTRRVCEDAESHQSA
jgi:catechol 2,3-dioxygenase-like lactoylglutathione lyase family enzyme